MLHSVNCTQLCWPAIIFFIFWTSCRTHTQPQDEWHTGKWHQLLHPLHILRESGTTNCCQLYQHQPGSPHQQLRSVADTEWSWWDDSLRVLLSQHDCFHHHLFPGLSLWNSRALHTKLFFCPWYHVCFCLSLQFLSSMVPVLYLCGALHSGGSPCAISQVQSSSVQGGLLLCCLADESCIQLILFLVIHSGVLYLSGRWLCVHFCDVFLLLLGPQSSETAWTRRRTEGQWGGKQYEEKGF